MFTSIQIKDETWLQLNALKLKGESFNDVVERLLLNFITLSNRVTRSSSKKNEEMKIR